MTLNMLISMVQRNRRTLLLTKPSLTTGLSVSFTLLTHTNLLLSGLIGGLPKGSRSLNLTFGFFAAYYYNRGHQWGEGVIINYKYDAFPEGTAVLDVERGQLGDISPFFWQTDTSICRKSWCHIKDHDYKSPKHIIRQLVDIVSKNGCLLLNVAPRADGTIPEEQQEILLKIGSWLSRYGEAIYGTRPWVTYKEGPTDFPAGSFVDGQEIEFTSRDIRFTQKGDYLYAIFMNSQEENQLVIESLGADKPYSQDIKDVEFLPQGEKFS